MMCSTVPLVLVALSAALAAPATPYDDYPVVVPAKRAALVLDRLLIALQKALHESPPRFTPADGPRTAALRVAGDDLSDRFAAMGEHTDEWLGPEDLRVAPLRPPSRELTDMTGLQRRGQAGGGASGLRGRVLRCYFNAITCF